MLHVCF